MRPAFRFLAISSIKNFCSRSASYSYYFLPPPPSRRFQIQSFLHAEENPHTRLILTYPLAFFGSPPPPALSWHTHFLTPPPFSFTYGMCRQFSLFLFLGFPRFGSLVWVSFTSYDPGFLFIFRFRRLLFRESFSFIRQQPLVVPWYRFRIRCLSQYLRFPVSCSAR